MLGERLADKGPKDDIVEDKDGIPESLGIARVMVGRVRDAAGEEEDGGERVWGARTEVGGEEMPVCGENERDEEELEGVR